MSTNILFTSVGRRVELLRAFRKAYETLGIPGRIVAVDVDPLAPALRLADRPYIVPRLNDPQFIPTLEKIVQREEVAAVFPLIDPDIPVLAAHRQVFEAAGARVAVVSERAAAIAADKWLTGELFQKLGLPTPRSWLPEQISCQSVEYPLFVKPRHGSASEKTFRVDNGRELDFFKQYVPNAIVQEYLPGPEITSDVICDLNGNLLGVVSRQRIRVRAGEVIVGKTVFDAAIAQGCGQLATVLPAIGPITVQCIMDNGLPKFTEINARMGGGLPLGIAAGANSAEWLLASVAGIEVEIPPIGSYQRDLHLSRFDDSMFLSEDDREQMANHRL